MSRLRIVPAPSGVAVERHNNSQRGLVGERIGMFGSIRSAWRAFPGAWPEPELWPAGFFPKGTEGSRV